MLRLGLLLHFAIQDGSVLGLLLASLKVLALHVLVELYRFMMTLEEFVAGYGWGCSPIALFGRGRGDISTDSGRCRCSPFQLCTSTVWRRRKDHGRILACIADTVGDTVGDIAGMEAVLSTCAEQVLIQSSDALENSWKAGRHPVLILSLGIAVGTVTLVLLHCACDPCGRGVVVDVLARPDRKAQFERARQPHDFRSPGWLLGHVRDALVGELPCPPP